MNFVKAILQQKLSGEFHFSSRCDSVIVT